MKTYPNEVQAFEKAIRPLLGKLSDAQEKVRTAVEEEANGKLVKGDQITAVLGEVLAAKLLGGRIQVSDKEPDIIANGMSYEVKTRVHRESSTWRESSAIASIDYAKKPDYLLFLELDKDSILSRAWCFPWDFLVDKGRFPEKRSRGNQIGHYFYLSTDLENSNEYQIYDRAKYQAKAEENEWLRAAAHNPAFAFLKEPLEDIYTLSDGKPFQDAR